MNESADITESQLYDIVSTMPTRRHYKPVAGVPVCGVWKEISELTEDGRLKSTRLADVQTTTHLRRVTCPRCALVLRADVNFICTRLGV